jgi:predicted helicase
LYPDSLRPSTISSPDANRCAFIQHQVKQDKRSSIRSDPNRADDEEYIVRLVGQVVNVSLETVRIVNGLPERYAEGENRG